jgi:hypothetical protein
MYGLEKKPKQFSFDLEIDIKEHPDKAKEMLSKIENNIKELKSTIKKGGKKEEIDKLTALLQGYMALQKVLTKVQKS